MTAISDVFSSPYFERLGWMLVHSVWEIGAIAGAYIVAIVCLPQKAAPARYWAGCIALLSMMLSLPVTFFALSGTTKTLEVGLSSLPFSNSPPAIPSQPQNSQLAASRPDRRAHPSQATPVRDKISCSWQTRIAPLLPWCTATWFAGVMIYSLRLIIGLFGVERLRRIGITTTAASIENLGRSLSDRFRMRRFVKFANSALVQVPTVVGYLRPIILLPATSLTGLSSREIEFLLAHELAHIKRHDYLHNMVQGLVETLLFYHPAMWWISSCVRRERENCCDDLVVSLLDDKAEYARTLYALEQRRSNWMPTLAANDGQLLHRIRRLIAGSAGAPHGRQWGKGLAGFVAITVIGIPLILIALTFTSENRAVASDTKSNPNDVTKKEQERVTNTPTFVRLVIGPNKTVTFEGKEIKWDNIEATLEKVTEPGSKVLEVAISTEDLSVREMNNAIGTASHYGRQFGFKYTSYIGVHPLGSKGTGSEVLPKKENSKAQPPANKKRVSGSVLTLPNGGTVELVAIAADDKEGKTWWAPNGTALKQAPWTTWTSESDSTNARLQRKFAFRLQNAPKSMELGAWRFHADNATSGDFLGAFGPDGKELAGALTIRSSFDKDAKTATVSLGIAARPQELVLKVDRSGKIISGNKDWIEAPTKILVAEHREQGGFGNDSVETFFGFIRPDFYDFDTSLIAIDLKGNEHFPFGFPVYHDDDGKSATVKPLISDDDKLRWGRGFQIRLSRIKEFRILARSTKEDFNWFTFDDVALRPRQDTQPKSWIEHLVREAAH